MKKIQILSKEYRRGLRISRLSMARISHSGLFVVVSAKFLRFELKDPKAEEFSEAIGFVMFSNSKVSVKSSKSLFELIWNEHLQYGKLQEYERRKEADKMKNEFINITHQLRTPIQPVPQTLISDYAISKSKH